MSRFTLENNIPGNIFITGGLDLIVENIKGVETVQLIDKLV